MDDFTATISITKLYKLFATCQSAKGKVSGSQKSLGFPLWGHACMSAHNFMAIQPIVVKIFQVGQTWWSEQPIDLAIPGAVMLERLKELVKLIF